MESWFIRGLLSALFLTGLAAGQENNPYFAFEESFALSVGQGFDRLDIVTFIPRTFLLFVEDREADTMIGGSKTPFLRVVTQDGVEVYVLESTVSDKPFKEIIGDHQIIFNDRYRLCRSLGCKREIDEQVWQVHRGDAFVKDADDPAGGIKLTGDRAGQQIVGYINENELNDLIRRGIVTRTDLPHPKYSISRVDLPYLKIDCGEVYESISRPYKGDQPELADSILRALNIGKIDRGSVTPKIKYDTKIGEPGKSTSFRCYRIENKRTGESFSLATMITYLCRKRGPRDREERIDFVEFRDPISGRQYDLDFDNYSSSDTLMDKITPPYLFSVNSYDQYSDLIDRLGQVFQDRALAGYFLAEFNRSCTSDCRNQPCCKGHSYE